MSLIMIWVTRNYVHVDRVACPWLIKRFVDHEAQFVFLNREEIPGFVEKTGAIPFDSGTGIELDHYEREGEKFCTFDAIVEKYGLTGDKALERVRAVVRWADTDKMDKSPLTWALEAIAVGSPLLCESDHDALAYEFPFYDSLYAYFQRELVFEEYRSELEGIKTRGGRLKFIKDKLHLV